MEGNDDRPYDAVIFGASGFTGKRVIREALRFLGAPSSPLKTLALAGRNPTKVSAALTWAASPSAPPALPILQADSDNPDSLLALCRSTRLVLACAGPFRLLGEPLVAACAEAGTDYLDITGEPEFMERMEVKYHEKAVDSGALVVSGCGFDSIPAELGFLFHSRQWVAPAMVNNIEAYLSLESDRRIVGNLGTYESAVLGVANAEELRELRRSRPRRPRPVIPGAPPPKGPLVEHQKDLGLWAIKLPSADATVVRRTLTTLTENPGGLTGVNENEEQKEQRKGFWTAVKPAHFGVKIGTKSLLGIVRFIFTGLWIGLLGTSEFGRSLLLKFPEFFTLKWFSKTGPSDEEIDSATFKMWFVGRGYSEANLVSQGNTRAKPDTEIVTRVSGPEIGYVTTPIVLLQCALVLLGQRSRLPKGGVYTPGIIFGPTDLQTRIQDRGISFDVISRKALKR